MKMKLKKGIVLISLLLSAIFVVIFGASSFAKYSFQIQENLVGHYVDYRLSHDGEGKSAILQNIGETEYKVDNTVEYLYNYEGFITISISNTLDGLISQRDISLSFRSPTASEIKNGITDAWQNKYSVSAESANYEIEVVDELGNSLVDNETRFTAKVEQTKTVKLKINRRMYEKVSNVKLDPISTVENLTIVLHTSIPYNDIQIFNVKVSSKLILITSTNDDYFGFDSLNVNIKTNYLYQFPEDTKDFSSLYPVKLEIIMTGNIIFDYERFRLSTEHNLIELSNDSNYTNGYYLTKTDGEISKITLFIPAASSLDLNFYLLEDKKGSLSVTATFLTTDTTNPYQPYTDIAGITDGIIYQLI